MPLTTPQHEEIAGLAQRGRMGFLNELADRWGVQYLEVARSYADAQRAFNSPSSTPAPSKPAAPAPAAEPALETPQEVQHEMTKGTPNPNHPGDAELIRMVAELREQGVVNLTKALADKLKVPHGTARKWHYKAQGSSPSSPNSPVPGFACETCRDSGYVEGGDAGVACECPIGRRIAGQMQAALAEPGAVAPVPGNVPLVDASAPTVPPDDRKEIRRFPSDCTVVGTTASADSLIKLVDSGTAPAAVNERIQIDKLETRVAKMDEQAREREALLKIAYADRTQLIDKVNEQGTQLSEYVGVVSKLNADVKSLLMENEQLQADLKATAETIEQAAQGCVIYQLIENDYTGRPEVLTMAPGDVLIQADEWARVYKDEGRRRIEIWHCVDTIALSGGNVVCTLRPGFAETAEEVA